MKEKMIINKIKELFYNKKKLKLISIIGIVGVVSIVLVVKADYIKSVIDGDPGYVKLKEKTALFAYRKTISLKEFKEDTTISNDYDKVKGPITAANIMGGFDSYTPSQIIANDSDDSSNNFNSNTSSNINNSSAISNNSNNTEDKTETTPNNKEEVTVDKSSFTGKDMIILEGDKFDLFERLELSATDVDGKNITKKIVITENDVDIYNPGLYTVKAKVELSNKNVLYKEFLVRVEPVKLQLAVNDIELSKDVLQKKESYTMSFKIDSSKDYIDVETVNINGKMYYPNKTTRRSLFSKDDIYSIQLVASDKAGIEDINFNTITMTDGTVVDINELKTIEVLKDEATIKDMVIENLDGSGKLKISFLINDIDDTINQAKLYVYDEEENVIVEKEVDKNKIINSILNINKNGVYKIKVFADEKSEVVSQNTKDYKRKELYSTSIEIKNARFSDESIEEANVEIASYVVYSDEEEFINELFLIKEISNYELQSYYEEGTIDTEQLDGFGSSTGNVGNGGFDSIYSYKEEQEYTIQYSTNNKLQVTIPTIGKMTEDAGEVPKKIISVTVPTNAAFTVRNDSTFIGTSLNITNNGAVPVDISVDNFIDTNDDNGIKLITDIDVNNSLISTYKRNEINLHLENKAENKTIYLGNRKLYSQLNSSSLITKDEDKKIATVLSSNTSRIDIGGKAGTNILDKDAPIRDNFKLILKIKRSSIN